MKQVSERIIKLSQQDRVAPVETNHPHAKYAFRWMLIIICVAFWVAAAVVLFI